MKAEMYYKSEYPKELRIQIRNLEELEYLKLIFTPNVNEVSVKKTGLVSDSWFENISNRISDRADFKKRMEAARKKAFIEDEDTDILDNFSVYEVLEAEIEDEITHSNKKD